jgi:hypothetical protein
MSKEKKEGTIIPINFDEESMGLLAEVQLSRFKKNGFKGRQSWVKLVNEAVKKAFGKGKK